MATDGRYSLRIDSASTEGGWYGTQFDEPIDITGKSKVIVDMKIVDMTTLVEEGTQTAIALVFGDRGVWCQTPQPWARAKAGTDPTVTLEFDTMTLDDGSTPCREVLSSSDLTLQAVGVFFDGKGSFRIDNVRAE